MKRAMSLALSALAVWCAVDIVSPAGHAQEVPPPPPPPGPAEPPADDGEPTVKQPDIVEGSDPTDLTKSDSDAIDLVKRAAERQGGNAVAEPGGLHSFHAVFGRVLLKSNGDTVREDVEADRNGVKIAWMQPNKIRTSWTIDGKTTVRGHTGRVGWIDDGTQSSNLLGERYEKDREQLERDQRMIGALLDVVFLGKMLRDGSIWKIARDPTYEGLCLARIAPEQGTQDVRSLDMKLWLDPETLDPQAAIIQPDGQGTSLLHYKFEYLTIAPKIRGAGDLRFPFHTEVYEQRIAEQSPFMIMDVHITEVDFNDEELVTAETFRRPERR